MIGGDRSWLNCNTRINLLKPHLFLHLFFFFPSNRGSGEKEEVNRHGSGGFFGEGALVNEGNNGGVRNAECVADATTTCYALERNDFQRLLGSMHELIALKSKARILKNVATFRSAAIPKIPHWFVFSSLWLTCFWVCSCLVFWGVFSFMVQYIDGR